VEEASKLASVRNEKEKKRKENNKRVKPKYAKNL
jgi:hypothetical protein